MIKNMRSLLGIPLFAVLLAGCAAPEKPLDMKEATKGKELVFAFQKQRDPAALQASADALSAELSTALGTKVNVLVPTSYGATVQALISDRAQVAYLSSLPFLLAKKEAPVEIGLVEVRNGKTNYDSVFVVRADSPYQKLEDLKGKRVAFTSPTSASGYVFPYATLVQKKLVEKGADPTTFFGESTFAGGYDQALRSVLNGQTDIAAVSDYTMEGPTADKYLNAEERKKLRILQRIPGVPTHLIALRSDLDPKVKEAILTQLESLAKNKPDLFADVYGAATFQRAKGPQHVLASQMAVDSAGLQVENVAEKP